MSEIVKKKTVSFSQFSKWFTCPYQWYRDYILKEKTFEDNLIMSFGTAIHETIQNFILVLYKESVEKAEAIDLNAYFAESFKKQIDLKKIPYTQAEYDGFVEDAKNILAEFLAPVNRARYFPTGKYELMGIEDDLNETILNNVNLNAKLDLVLREKATGIIKIIDFKTSTNGWNSYQKEDFTKTSQLVLYKAVYSKKYNVPLSKIQVEFIILKRKLYEKSKFVQSRIDTFKPSASEANVRQVIGEFSKFVSTCFTSEGLHNTAIEYPKIPGDRKKNCKYCQYLKNGKCDGVASKGVL